MPILRWLDIHAPKIDPESIRLNLLFRGEPHAWKRAGHAYSRYYDDPENVKAKKDLVERFEWTNPKWKAIERRRLGTQMFFATLFDSKDPDNLSKLVLDAFNKKIWHDDHQVKELFVRAQVVAKTPFTQLVVYLLE